MRLLLACSTLFFAAASVFAQSAGPASLRSLDFLLGVWISEDSGQEPETTEFHWAKPQEKTVLVGRHWAGDAKECPWCVTQAVMVAYYDTASSGVHVYFGDKTPRVMDFILMSAREKSLEFLTAAAPGRPSYRLTYQLLPTNVLSITLEEAMPEREGDFSSIGRWSFHRGSLLF